MRSICSLQLLAAIWGLLFLSCDSSVSEVSALMAFKEAIYEDPFSVLLNWNTVDPDPCHWQGITCSPKIDRVMVLNLSDSSLKGFLAPELGSLTSLQKLILHKNYLIGTIPKEIGSLRSLTVLDLSLNNLSGSIPHEIGNLTKVMKIYLQSNELSGSIPLDLSDLMNLVELRLDRNKLRGIVPGSNSNSTFKLHQTYSPNRNASGFCRLSKADFSYNFFDGRIPSCLEHLPRSSFQGNCFQDRDLNSQRSLQQCGGSPLKSHQQDYREYRPAQGPMQHSSLQPRWLLSLEIITGTIVALLMVFAFLTAVKKWKVKSQCIILWKKSANGKEQIGISIDAEILKDVLRLSREELEVACEDFSNIIGSSPDSVAYKGTIKDGSEIAVISLCISEEHWTSYLERYFQSKVADLARLNHENTGKLLGYCKESTPFSRMLVFEYASNGTLYEHLHHGEGCHLSWTRRMKIIIGIAHGLKYLHTEVQPPFTVSELNSRAVYLTENLSPKLVDFESWKTVLAKSEKNSGLISNGGVFNILPDSLERQHMDVPDNTFAFGVLLLEIISGRPPYCKDRGCLVDWAREYLELPEVMCYMVDPELRHFKFEDLRVICEVVNLCVHPDPSKRPSMQSVSDILENGINTSTAAHLKESPLAWAELAISS